VADRWFCKVLDREMGPLGFEDLAELARSGTLAGGDPVRPEGSDEWTAAQEVAGLFASSENEPARAARGARCARKRGLILGGVAVALVSIVAVFAWRLAGTSPEDPDAPATLADRFTQDFREQFTPQALELIGGRPPLHFWKVEPEGLRLTLAEGSDLNYCAVSPRIVVKGDFEITAGFAILDLPKPTEGFGAGALISVEEEQGERASLQRLHRQREGHALSPYRGRLKEDGTYDHSSQIQPLGPGGAKSGRLRLRREGTRALYEVGDPDGRQFAQIHEEDFPAGDVTRLRLVVQTGGSPTRVDVVWTHLDVRAEELTRLYEPPEKPRFWRRLLVGLVAVLLAGAVCLAVWAWLARRAYFRQAQPVDRARTT